MKRVIEQRGQAVQMQSYMAFGHSAAGPSASLAFNGERKDGVLQGYALGNGHRVYGPALMRFFSPDGLSPFGAGGVNAYAYCSGDPVNLHDPSGRFGTKTGLTKLLKRLDLPKPQLRDYLKPLELREKRWVYRLKGDQFERFEFMGAGTKILGAKRDGSSAFSAYLNSETFYRSGDLFIPQSTVPPQAVVGLENSGFEVTRFNTETFSEIMFPGGASAQTSGVADTGVHRRANDYVVDPVAEMSRIRSTAQD